MTTIQEDRFSMYYVVMNTCDKYHAVWETNAVFAATYNLWVAKNTINRTKQGRPNPRDNRYNDEQNSKAGCNDRESIVCGK